MGLKREAISRRVERLFAPAVVVAFVLALLLASGALGARLPPLGTLPPIPTFQQLDTSPGGIRSLPLLRDSFVAQALGEETLAALLGVRASGGASPLGTAGDRDQSGRDQTGQDQENGNGPQPRTLPRIPSILEGDWDLAIDMGADRATVRPGEHIVYTVRVRNVGTEDFKGQFEIASHHPFGTTDSTSPCEGDAGVEPDPDHPCVGPPVPVPGTPGDGVHTASAGASYAGAGAESLEPGGTYVFRFRVRVNQTVAGGTELSNHAHLNVTTGGQEQRTSDTVVVRVE